MPNGFNEIAEYEQKRVTSENIQLILDMVKELKEKISDLREGQKQIREDLRNIDKLRKLKK